MEFLLRPIFAKKVNEQISFPIYICDDKMRDVIGASTLQPLIPEIKRNQSMVGTSFDNHESWRCQSLSEQKKLCSYQRSCV